LHKNRTVFELRRTVFRSIREILSPPLTPSADRFVTAVVTAIDRAFCVVPGTGVEAGAFALLATPSRTCRFLINRTKPRLSENSPFQFAPTCAKFVILRAAVEHVRF
jgi:hypothetical protein